MRYDIVEEPLEIEPLIAAVRDGMVSRASAEELFMRAPEPKTFVTIASDHTYAGEHSRAAVLEWLNERHPRT